MNIQKRLDTLLKTSKDYTQPRISIAFATHRISLGNKHDSIAYGNLLKQVKSTLEANYNPGDWEQTFERLEKIKEDNNFWKHLADGLVILACNEQIEIFHLNYQVATIASVGIAFHIQPLLLADKMDNNYYLVDLAKDRMQMYEVSESGLNEIKPPNIKLKFADLYTDVDANTNFNTASYSGGTGVTHGHRERSSEEDKYREKYFRYLDLEFIKLHSETNNKFILAGTNENITEFKKLTQAKFYLEKIIDKPLSSLDNKTIVNEIKLLLKPKAEPVLKNINAEIQNAENNQKLLTDFLDIVNAVSNGMVAKIIVKSQKEIVNVQLDELIVHALENNIQVFVVNANVELAYPLVAILHY